jgi:hypothetical protein
MTGKILNYTVEYRNILALCIVILFDSDLLPIIGDNDV